MPGYLGIYGISALFYCEMSMSDKGIGLQARASLHCDDTCRSLHSRPQGEDNDPEQLRVRRYLWHYGLAKLEQARQAAAARYLHRQSWARHVIHDQRVPGGTPEAGEVGPRLRGFHKPR